MLAPVLLSVLPEDYSCSYILDCISAIRSPTLQAWPRDGIHVYVTRSPLITSLDIFTVIACAIFFTAFRTFFWNNVLLPLAHFGDIHVADHVSFCESGVQLVFYSVMWTFAVIVCLRSEFFFETWRCWEWPLPNQVISSGIWWIYMLQIGWYVHCTYAHVFLDKRKRDFWAMLTHHLVTLLLLGGSYIVGYFRVGILVLISMDVCDVFLHSMKMVRFYDVRHPISTPLWVKTSIFITLPASWFIFRIVYYIFVVLWCSSYEFVSVTGFSNAYYIIPFNLLLLTLLILQIYWFTLITKIAIRHIKHGEELNDSREARSLHLEEKGSKQ